VILMQTPERPAVDLKATFADLPLSDTMLQALGLMGFEHPTPIQEKAIPEVLNGKDVIGQARTGTGKTAAFGIPFVETFDPSVDHVQGLVLAPTRELAMQIGEEIEQFAAGRDFKQVCVYGGAAYEPQEKAFRDGVHLVVGTPGRIMDHMERGNLDLSKCEYVVLDEADRMLDMGFIDDMEWILRHLPHKSKRRTQLFSATMPTEIKGLARRFMTDPVMIRVSSDDLAVPATIEQIYYQVGRRNKHWALTRMLDDPTEKIDLTIVFCATKSMCDRLVDDLNRWGYNADALHGDLPQNKREKVLEQFDNGAIKILVATDVAARGLDIDRISHVINWDMPEKEPENYVHRVGRTGRAGRSGKAVAFIGLDDKGILRRVEMLIGSQIKQMPVPDRVSGRDKVDHKIDWDELADKYGDVHVHMNVGRNIGLTPFKLHRLVQKGTGLPDHAIRGIIINDDEASFAIPNDIALRARNGVRTAFQSQRGVEVDFLDKETTVRSA
jgi:ATP-dependent RNA helicase DeaD